MVRWGQIAPGDQAQRLAAEVFRADLYRRSLPDAMTLVFSLDLLTEITAAIGDFERAATLIGAARNRWQTFTTSVRRWKVIAEPRRKWETRIREVLGEAAFTAAVRRGAGFTTDDMISYALGEKVQPAPDAEHSEPDVRLTRREAQIAELVAQGLSNKQIAAQLVISQRTAEITKPTAQSRRKSGLASIVQRVARGSTGGDVPAGNKRAAAPPARNHRSNRISSRYARRGFQKNLQAAVVGLRRAGVSAGDVRALKNALGVLRAAARLDAALAALATDASPLVRELGEFIRGSARGFAHPTKR